MAERTVVYIGLDYPAKESHWDGYSRIKAYLNSCGNLGFKDLIVFVREKNYGFGPNGNGRTLINEVGKKYDRYILSEDDNEFSPNFLVYQNRALEKYKDEKKIMHICAYTPHNLQGISDNNIFCTIDCPAYGTGYWYHKQNVLASWNYQMILETIKRRPFYSIKAAIEYPLLMNQIITMIKTKKNYGDLRFASYNLFNNTFSLCPSISLSRNWGCDGTGEHSGFKVGVETLKISADGDFNLDDIELKLPPRFTKLINEGEYRGFSLWIMRCKMVIRVVKLIISH